MTNNEDKEKNKTNDNSRSINKNIELKEGEDFYFDESGLMVFTQEYHLKRGYCCKSGCRHCPYNYRETL